MGVMAVVWAPVLTLSRVAEERRVLAAFVVTAIYAALSLAASAILVFGGTVEAQLEASGTPLPPELGELLAYFDAFLLLTAVVSPFLYWLLVSGLMHLVTGFFGGIGPFSGTLAVVGVAQIPLVISTILGTPLQVLQFSLDPQSPATILVSLLNGALGLAFLGWYVVLVVIGAASARRVGYGASAGSYAISCGGCLGLIIIAVLALVLVAVLAGAAGSAGIS